MEVKLLVPVDARVEASKFTSRTETRRLGFSRVERFGFQG